MSKKQRSKSSGESPPAQGLDAGRVSAKGPVDTPIRRRRRRLFHPERIGLPPGRFRPEHCPNRDCPFYDPQPAWRFSHWGFYRSPVHSKPLPRYQCRHCKRTFTARTFSSTYWLHRWDLLPHIAKLSVAGSGVRQIARVLEVSHSTVARHLTRAGRLGFLLHRRMVQDTQVTEPIVVDGFETFEYSQFYPCHYNLAVGQESWFLYHFTDSPLRRKGTMTPEQKQRRGELESIYGRPDPKAVENGVLELLKTLLRLDPKGSAPSGQVNVIQATTALSILEDDQQPCSTPVTRKKSEIVLYLHSDEHPAYERALRRIREFPGCPPIQHRQTPSTLPRTRANALFPVNLADLLFRHCEADHRRETIAFDKRRQGGLERAAVFTVWRNAIKWRREGKPGETAAMASGILKGRLSWRQVFARRLFPRERDLPGCWWEYYWRRVKTLPMGEHQTENRAAYAY